MSTRPIENKTPINLRSFATLFSLSIAFAFTLTPTPSVAQTIAEWTGDAGTNDWTDAANWLTGEVPYTQREDTSTVNVGVLIDSPADSSFTVDLDDDQGFDRFFFLSAFDVGSVAVASLEIGVGDELNLDRVSLATFSGYEEIGGFPGSRISLDDAPFQNQGTVRLNESSLIVLGTDFESGRLELSRSGLYLRQILKPTGPELAVFPVNGHVSGYGDLDLVTDRFGPNQDFFNPGQLLITGTGVVEANRSAHTLAVRADLFEAEFGIVNQGTLRAVDGGRLSLSGRIDNRDNRIEEIGPWSHVTFHDAEVIGGAITSDDTIPTDIPSIGPAISLKDTTLTDVELNGFAQTESRLTLSGQFINRQLLEINENSNLHIDGDVQLAGVGEIKLNESEVHRAINTDNDETLTTFTNVDNTITGEGGIGFEGGSRQRFFRFVNGSEGHVQADATAPVASGTLRLNLASGINRGLLQATNGGELYFRFPPEFDFDDLPPEDFQLDNDGGTIEVNDDSTIFIDPGWIIGGTLKATDSGQFRASGFSPDGDRLRLRDLQIESDGNAFGEVDLLLDGDIAIDGIVNTRDIRFATFEPLDSTTLRGGGTVIAESIETRFGHVLKNVDNTIVITSQGLSFGESAFPQFENGDHGILVLDNTSVDVGSRFSSPSGTESINRGIVRTQNGFLRFNHHVDNTDGVIESLNGASIDVGSVNGGTLATEGTGRMRVRHLEDVTIDGSVFLIHHGSLSGTIENRDRFEVRNFSNEPVDLRISDGVQLTGAGNLEVIAGSRLLAPQDSTEPSTFTNVDNRIYGNGFVGDDQLRVINQSAGVIEATGPAGSLVIDTAGEAGLTNLGTLKTSGGATLELVDQHFGNDGTIFAKADSTILGTGTLTNRSTGMLTGEGTINFDHVINEGIIVPGERRGSLGINGDLTLMDSSSLILEIAAFENELFDAVNVDGTVELGGELRLYGATYDAFDAYETISVLTSTAGINGRFDHVLGTTGQAGTLDDYGLAVTYTDMTVDVTQALLGDTNLDGVVDIFEDGFVFLDNIGTASGASWQIGDFSGDGIVDIFNDGFALLDNLGRSAVVAAPSTSAVPEPNALLLLTLSSFAFAARRRRV